TELRPHVLQRGRGVLHHVVDQPGRDGRRVQVEVRQDLRHLHTVHDVLLARRTTLPLVRSLGEPVGPRDRVHVQPRRVWTHGFLQPRRQRLQAVARDLGGRRGFHRVGALWNCDLHITLASRLHEPGTTDDGPFLPRLQRRVDTGRRQRTASLRPRLAGPPRTTRGCLVYARQNRFKLSILIPDCQRRVALDTAAPPRPPGRIAPWNRPLRRAPARRSPTRSEHYNARPPRPVTADDRSWSPRSLRRHQPRFHERHVPRVAYDDMIQDRDPDDPPGLHELACDLPVLPRGRGITRWMVV